MADFCSEVHVCRCIEKLCSARVNKTLRQHLEMVYKSRISAGNLCCTVSQERFLARKMRICTMSIVPTLFLGVEYCATNQAALYIETHSLMYQSEFHAASVAL